MSKQLRHRVVDSNGEKERERITQRAFQRLDKVVLVIEGNAIEITFHLGQRMHPMDLEPHKVAFGVAIAYVPIVSNAFEYVTCAYLSSCISLENRTMFDDSIGCDPIQTDSMRALVQ